MPHHFSRWVNGKKNIGCELQDFAKNNAFRFGDGIFETLLICNGRLNNPKAHFNRLRKGLNILNYDLDDDQFQKWILEPVEVILSDFPDLEYAKMRIEICRINRNGYLPEPGKIELWTEIKKLNFNPWKHSKNTKLTLFKTIPIFHSPLSIVKGFNGSVSVSASTEADKKGFDDALIFSQTGEIAETAKSNIFVWKNKCLYTPDLETGCLPGTIREIVLESAMEMGISFSEVKKDVSLFQDAEEVFITNSLIGLQKVDEIEGIYHSNGHDAMRIRIFNVIKEKTGYNG